MKTLQQYLTESKKIYKYKVKMIREITDDVMDHLESAFKKYDVESVSKPTKSILQQRPIGFSDVGPAEVWSIEIETSRPASSYVLRTDVCQSLGISEKFVLVQGSNDPLELQQRAFEELAEIANKADDKEAAALLDFQEEIENLDPSYGNDYNQKLLNYLGQIQANKAQEIKSVPSVFAWLQTLKAVDDAHTGDGVKPVSGSTLKPGKEAEMPADVAADGNFDDRNVHIVRTFKDAKDKFFKIKGDK